jgi:hypothetical protein
MATVVRAPAEKIDNGRRNVAGGARWDEAAQSVQVGARYDDLRGALVSSSGPRFDRRQIVDK